MTEQQNAACLAAIAWLDDDCLMTLGVVEFMAQAVE